MCSNIVVSADQDSITCDLAEEPPAGRWFPIVTEELGKVKFAQGVVAEGISL